MRIPDSEKVGFFVNDTGLVFIGSFAKALLDSLGAHFESFLSSRIGKELVDKRAKEIVSQELSIFKSKFQKKLMIQ